MDTFLKGAMIGIAAHASGDMFGKAFPNLQWGGANMAQFAGAAAGGYVALWILRAA